MLSQCYPPANGILMLCLYFLLGSLSGHISRSFLRKLYSHFLPPPSNYGWLTWGGKQIYLMFLISQTSPGFLQVFYRIWKQRLDSWTGHAPLVRKVDTGLWHISCKSASERARNRSLPQYPQPVAKSGKPLNASLRSRMQPRWQGAVRNGDSTFPLS